MKQYRRRMQRFPFSLPHGPQTQLDAGYEELLQHMVRPPPTERPTNKQITYATWKVVNYRGMLRRKGMPSQAAVHNLGWKIKACLKADPLKHATTTASNVEGCLVAREYTEAWRYLKGWYPLVENKPQNHALSRWPNKQTRGSSCILLSAPQGGQCAITLTPPASLVRPRQTQS